MIDHLNLLPYEYRRRGLLRRRRTLWGVVFIAAALSMAGVYGASYAAMKNQRDEMLELEASCEPLRKLEVDSQAIAKNLAELGGRKSLLAKLDRGEQPVQLIGLLADAVRRGEEHVVVNDLLIEPFRIEESYVERDAQGQEKNLVRQLDRFRLRVAAFGSDDLHVAHFVSVLKDSSVFEDVTLISSGEQLQRGGLREFIVECVFE
jgi:hypothetical protein